MGEERLGRLCEALMDAGRMEDLKKAVSNEEYRKELYQEFDILQMKTDIKKAVL